MTKQAPAGGDLDNALDQVKTLAGDARTAVMKRNTAIRHASALGLSGRAIAERAGLTHRAVQMILDKPDGDAKSAAAVSPRKSPKRR